MLKSIRFSISCALITIMTGCGISDYGNISDSGNIGNSGNSSSSNSTKLTWNDTHTDFTITTKVNNVGATAKYYHVGHLISDTNDKNVLQEGVNYTGTITTTCVRELMTSTFIQYDCTTHRETSSPVGDPKDETKTITLYDNKKYKVFLEENGFYNDNKVEIDSIN